MAEEHRCQTPESNRLCVNNCGFLGSSATMNLCSNCYGDLCLKQQQQSSSIKSTVESSLSVSPPSSSSSEISSPIIPPLLKNPSVKLEVPEKKAVISLPTTEQNQQQRPNRCTTCRKRVGLTGFKCRCGTMFCGVHRYPEIHGCSYDFKSAGREEIAKANPLVKAAKLQKIWSEPFDALTFPLVSLHFYAYVCPPSPEKYGWCRFDWSQPLDQKWFIIVKDWLCIYQRDTCHVVLGWRRFRFFSFILFSFSFQKEIRLFALAFSFY